MADEQLIELFLSNDTNKEKQLSNMTKKEVLALVKKVCHIEDYYFSFSDEEEIIANLNEILKFSSRDEIIKLLNEETDEKDIFYALIISCNILTDEDKIEFLKKFKSDNMIEHIISSLNSDKKKQELILTMNLDNKIIASVVKSFKNKEDKLKYLKVNPNTIKFSDIKYLLSFNANVEWEYYSDQHKELYKNFSYDMQMDLKNYGYLEVLQKYDLQVKEMVKVLDIDYEIFEDFFKNYQEDTSFSDNELIRLVKNFIAKSKQNYIDKYLKEKLEYVKNNYYKVNEESIRIEAIKNKKKKLFLNVLGVDRDLKKFIGNVIDKYFKCNKIDNIYSINSIVQYVLDGNDDVLENIFKIKKPTYYVHYIKNKTYQRLVNNYQNFLNGFDSYESESVVNFLNGDLDVNQIRKLFNKKDFKTLLDVYSLVKGSDSFVAIDFSKIKILNDTKPLSIEQLNNVQEYEKRLFDLKKLKKEIYLIMQDMIKNNDVKLNENDLKIARRNLFNHEQDLILDINKIDDKIINIVVKNHIENIKYINKQDKSTFDKLFVDDNLILHTMVYSSISEMNNFNKSFQDIMMNWSKICNKFEAADIALTNINQIKQIAEIYNYIDDVDMAILGENIAKKIIYNETFVADDSKSGKSQRIKNSIKYNILAHSFKDSSIPFYELAKGNICTRFSNTDPAILTSGIDTDSCCRIDGDNNDFLVYTMLNKNGIVLKLTDEHGKFFGKVSGFRNGNVLYFNQLRSINDVHGFPNKELLEKNKEMRELLKNYAKDLIEITKNSEYPIEHVLILRGYGFTDCTDLETVNRNSLPYILMDTTNNNWNDFTKINKPVRNNGFATDYDGGQTVFLLATNSHENTLYRSDIKEADVKPIYERPRQIIIENIKNSELLDRINYINALNCYVGSDEEQQNKKKNFKLIDNFSDIANVICGEDWYQIILNNGNELKCILPFDERAEIEYQSLINSQKKIR